MKHLLSIALIALVMGSTMEPPPGDCYGDEVWRCYMAGCTTTLLACPTIYEDGKYIESDCHNQTRCNWDCECVKKTNEGE